MGFTFEDAAKAELTPEQQAAIQGCKGLQAMAGLLPGMQWLKGWQQLVTQHPSLQHLAGGTWQQRTVALLEVLGRCLHHKASSRRWPPFTGLQLFKQAANAPTCTTFNMQLLGKLQGLLLLLLYD